MKKQIVIAILTLGVLVFAGGCMATQQEVQDLTNTVNQIVPAVREEVAKANVNIEDVLTKVETVNEAVKEKADEGFVEQLIAANEATSPINPYYPVIASILFAVNELRKRKGYEKGVARLESEAAPEEAKKIHDTVKHYTKRLIP